MILPIFANLDDIFRLYKLEAAGLLPKGTTLNSAQRGLDYLERIEELELTSATGQRQPVVTVSPPAS